MKSKFMTAIDMMIADPNKNNFWLGKIFTLRKSDKNTKENKNIRKKRGWSVSKKVICPKFCS